ncbi:MAG TPA: cysteine-rich CWC family protein [Pyrinomonadaceae bacterium]|nr:cysteine-rich CWC family protein [Pyrinomonadaceae bacterium]
MSKLQNMPPQISPRLAGEAKCEACGNEFLCGASLRGCWCSEIKLSDATRADLKSQYRDCLCRECLERMSEPSASG